VNDLPATTDSQSKPIIYGGNISITIAYLEVVYSKNIMNDAFETKANGSKPANWHLFSETKLQSIYY
jgi:hypothetical protein